MTLVSPVQATAFFDMCAFARNADAWLGSGPNVSEADKALEEIFGGFCLALYTLEMFLRMLGFGLWQGPNAYLKRTWCLFDFFIVISSYVEIFLRVYAGVEIGSVQFLRFGTVSVCFPQVLFGDCVCSQRC